jgi:hypothetical protein
MSRKSGWSVRARSELNPVAYCRHPDNGAPNTNRTCDLPLRRGLLYPLSYRGVARILT